MIESSRATANSASLTNQKLFLRSESNLNHSSFSPTVASSVIIYTDCVALIFTHHREVFISVLKASAAYPNRHGNVSV